jgi:hypothetical protein
MYGGAVTVPYQFSSNTTAADPGNGTLRLNQSEQNTSTSGYVDLLAYNGVNVTSVLDSMDDSNSSVVGQIRIVNRYDDSKF